MLIMVLRNTGWGIEFNEDIVPIGPLSNVRGKLPNMVLISFFLMEA